MSRIGLNPIKIEEGVTVEINEKTISVKGKLGSLQVVLPASISANVADGQVLVSRANDEKPTKSLHGTFRMLIANAIHGVSVGFEKKLEIVGVGYRARMDGSSVAMSLGWTHEVKFAPPEGIVFELPDENTLIVKGYDKQKVGETAAKIRNTRKPEPYKGKGIKYENEYVRRKSSKSLAGK